jgi:hypothetical protein
MSNKRGFCAHTSRRGSCLAARVSSADYDHIKIHSHGSRRLVFIRYGFRGKHTGFVSRETFLLANTEIAEDDVQDVLYIDSADKPPQRIGRGAQFLRNDFFPTSQSLANRTAQGSSGLLQKMALTFARNQSWLAWLEISTSKIG